MELRTFLYNVELVAGGMESSVVWEGMHCSETVMALINLVSDQDLDPETPPNPRNGLRTPWQTCSETSLRQTASKAPSSERVLPLLFFRMPAASRPARQ